MDNQEDLKVIFDFIKKHFNKIYENHKHKLNLNMFNNRETKIKITNKLIIDNDHNNVLSLEYTDENVKISFHSHSINIIYKQFYKINLTININDIKLEDNEISDDTMKNKGLGTEGMKYLITFLKQANYNSIYGKIGGFDNYNQITHFYKKNGFNINDNDEIYLKLN